MEEVTEPSREILPVMATTSLRTTCARDCPDSCGVLATLEDGRITALRGDPAHPITRGFLCRQGHHFLERFYDPARVLHPMRRTDTGWQRISWDDALALVARKLCEYRDRFGPKSILSVTYSGMRGQVAKALGKLFWAHFGGVTASEGGLSIEANGAAQALDFGGDATHDPEDLANASAYVLWGKNPAVTRLHSLPFIQQGRSKGAPLVVIDPVFTATAQKADTWYPLRPGSDGWLALGIARALLERGAIDASFISLHTHAFEAYRATVMARSLEEVAAATDLSVSQVLELADLYATRKPLATMIGLGTAYWPRSGQIVRLIDALAALTGNIGIPGGGAHSDIDSSLGHGVRFLQDAPAADVRHVLLPRLGEDILEATDPPLKMAWIAGANPAFATPNAARTQEALRSLDFLVVVDQFMTATAQLADLVLPCTTFLETDDLICSYGHRWIGLARRVVEPLGEARTDAEILQDLATRLGFGRALHGSPQDWMRRLLEPMAEQGVTLDRLEQGAARKPGLPAVPFSDHRFGTPSGKFEFVETFDPAPSPEEPPEDDQVELHLVATKIRTMLNSQVLPRDLPEEPVVRVHPMVLQRLGLADGGSAVVESPVASLRVRVRSDETVRRDVLLFNPPQWRGDPCGVNQLREALLTDVGQSAAMHATRVRLARVPPGP